MNCAKRTPLAWVIPGLFVVLVAANATLWVLLRAGGPFIGTAFYAVLFAVTWRGRPRDYQAAMVGGLVGLVVHAVEVALIGWSAYPTLMALNLVLPAVLALMAWWMNLRGR
jgi:ABC-type Co2+ transport system permease subunit